MEAPALRTMIDSKAVLDIVPVSYDTLLRMVKRGEFPKPRTISKYRVAWYLDEVEAWQKALPDDPPLHARINRTRKARQ